MIKKKLVFYLYGSDKMPEIYNLHFLCINLFQNIFDEFQFVISVDNNNQQTFEKYKSILQSCIEYRKAEYIMIKNDPVSREYNPFKTFVIEQIPKLRDTWLFYAHGKGMSDDWADTNIVRRWIMAMYYFNLNYIDDVENKFHNGYDAYGTMLIRKKEPERQNEWYFAGTFQ